MAMAADDMFSGVNVIDNSKSWAVAVVKPFPFSVVELHELRRALSEPLPLPIPIGSATYAQLLSGATDFVPVSSYPAERIAGLTTAFIRSRIEMGMCENLLQSSVWDFAFCNLWLELLSLADVSIVELDRYQCSFAQPNTSTMLWILNRLCAKFEQKLSMHEALNALMVELFNLKAEHYGPVHEIIGVALAGGEMAAWSMRQGQFPDSLIGPLKMTSVRDRMACLKFSVNLLRVALSLAELYCNLDSRYPPRPIRSLRPLVYGEHEQIRRTLRIVNDKVFKEISPWSEHVDEGFTRLDFVNTAYSLHKPGLVSGEVAVSADRYKVTMNTLGYEQRVHTEAGLLEAVVDVLKGLKALHAVGLVHRDIRWENILKLRANGYMLIDFETVWKCDREPACCWLRVWDEDTLVRSEYKKSSDLYLVGKLMSILGRLSQEARSFQSMLLEHRFASAEEALERATAISTVQGSTAKALAVDP